MEKETVDLIAMGYEWKCPECENFNETIEILEVVECSNCGRKFRVFKVEHAYG